MRSPCKDQRTMGLRTFMKSVELLLDAFFSLDTISRIEPFAKNKYLNCLQPCQLDFDGLSNGVTMSRVRLMQ